MMFYKHAKVKLVVVKILVIKIDIHLFAQDLCVNCVN